MPNSRKANASADGSAAMGRSKAITSARAPAPVGAFPHARLAGGFLFLSGIGPRTPGSNEVPGNVYDAEGNVVQYDFAAQCRAVFRNVRTILEDSGAAWKNIVDVTVFLTDMKRDFPTMNLLYAEAFQDAQPTRTTVEVGSLPTPIAIECKVIAWIGDPGKS